MKRKSKYSKEHNLKESSVKDMLKKTWHFLWEEESLTSYIAFIIIAFVVLKFIFFPSFLFVMGYSDVAAVVSGSMIHNNVTEHTFYNWLDFNDFNRSDVQKWPFLNGLNVGDVISVKKVPPKDIHVGDIILFYSDKGQIIHRVMYIQKQGNNYFYTTKGDANPVIMELEKNIPYYEIKGKLVSKIPYVGWPKVIFSRIVPF